MSVKVCGVEKHLGHFLVDLKKGLNKSKSKNKKKAVLFKATL